MKIEYISFTSHTGYAVAARNSILALKGHYDISIFPLDFQNTERISGQDTQTLNALERKDDKERIQIFHCTPPIQHRRKKKKKITIGYATFEAQDYPKSWIQILNKNTFVVAPSSFNLENAKRAGIRVPLFYVPHCIDMKRYNPNVVPLKTYPEFVFLFIGSWRERKGYQELLTAWFEEFSKEDNVILFIKTDKPKNAERIIQSMKRPGAAPIFIESNILSEDIMPSFIKSTNCLILPTKGEGFGLPGLQAMALGVPVIVTDYSGCQEYAKEETATLLKPEGFIKMKQMDLIPQFANQKWAHVSVTQIRKVMRTVLENYPIMQQKATFAAEYVRHRFDYDSVVQHVKEMLSRLNK